MILDALDNHVCPSGKILGDHRQGMNGRLGVLCEATELMSVELAELN